MPTAARLICAGVLVITAFYVSGLVMPLMPEGTDFGIFTYVNMAIGFVAGWRVTGARAGKGTVSGITNGLTGMIVMVFWALFVQGANEMFARAMKHRYDGPFEAVGAIFQLGFEYGVMIFVPNILASLLIGGVVAGLAGEFAAKRWR